MASKSIVDYLKSQGKDSSFSYRSQLAKQYGITNYKGTAEQNTKLLNYIQSANKNNTKPIYTKPVKVAPITNTKPVKVAPITNIATKPVQQKIDQKTLQELSIRALNGDINAQNKLKQMGVKQLTGQALWKGYDPSNLQTWTKAWKQYLQDNPYSEYTKNQEMQRFKLYTEKLKRGEPISPEYLEWYRNTAKKWNLQYQDYSNPLVQAMDSFETNTNNYLDEMKKKYEEYLNALNREREDLLNMFRQREQQSLEAQDVALNDALRQADDMSFQRFIELQQQFADRGIGDSGIAQDAYLRSQMATNQAYQDAFARAAQNKAQIQNEIAKQLADIQSSYTDKIGSLNIDLTDKTYKTKTELAERLSSIKQAISEQDAKSAAELLARQDERDKFLTQQTGIVYIDGKPLKDSKGNPVYTVDYQALLEKQRHNKAKENIDLTKAKLNYSADLTKAQLNYSAEIQKITANTKVALEKLKVAQKELDLNVQKAKNAMEVAQAKLEIASKNAQTNEMKARLSGLKAQLNALQKQIKGKPTKEQKKKLNAIMNQISELVSGK